MAVHNRPIFFLLLLFHFFFAYNTPELFAENPGQQTRPDFRRTTMQGSFAGSVRFYKEYMEEHGASAQLTAELGLLQSLEALEHLAQKWTAHQLMVPQIFPADLPVRNRIFTYRSFRRFLKVLYRELDEARVTLAKVTEAWVPDQSISIPFSYADLALDFTADGMVSPGETLEQFLEVFPLFEVAERDQKRLFLLDRADLIWLQSYLGLLQGGIDLILSYDWEEVFYQYDEVIRIDTMGNRRYPNRDFFLMHSVFLVQENRFPQAKEHFLRSLNLGPVMWEAISLETDDAGEWIPGTHQTNWRGDILITEEKIMAHQALLNQMVRLLEGEELLEVYPGMTISLAWFLEHPRTINLLNPLRPLLSSGETGQGVSLAEIKKRALSLGEDWLSFLLWVN